MFRFYTEKKWWLWSWIGSAIILSSLWVQVQIDVKINEWFGQFYDMIQKALATPNAITIGEYWGSLSSIMYLAIVYVLIAVAVSYFTANCFSGCGQPLFDCLHISYAAERTMEAELKGYQKIKLKFAAIMEGLVKGLIKT